MNRVVHKNSGVTMIEFIGVFAILVILSTVTLTTFIHFRNNQSLDKDTETIVETLEQARNQTLSSQNASQYGVHITSSKVTLFTGSSYTNGASGNIDVPLTSSDAIVTITLTGGGGDVVFQRLTGETTQDGTVVISSSSIGKTRTITIFKTGVVQSQ